MPTPNDFPARILRGDVAFQKGEYEGALSAYLAADGLKPGGRGARGKLKVGLTLLGRAAEAQTYR